MGGQRGSASGVAVHGRVPNLVSSGGRVAFGLLSLVSLVALARCSLVTSLDGLTGGGDAGSEAVTASSPDGQAPAQGGSDAQTPTSDAQPLDATSTTAADGDAGGAAGRDGGDAATHADAAAKDAAGEDAGAPVFADDFEGAQPLPRQWDVMATSDGTLALDTSLFVSPATSLRASAFPLDAGAPGNAANVTLRKLLPMPATGTTVAYDFHAIVKQYDAVVDAVIGALQISDGAGDLYELQLDVRQNGSGGLGVIFAEYTGIADGGSTYVGHPVVAPLPVEAWTHLRVELDVAAPPVARVYFDGTLALETEVTIAVQGTAIQLSLGLSYVASPSAAWVVNYDDAALWLLPLP